MPHSFETNNDEGVRQVFSADSISVELLTNVRRYEEVRHDKIYDQHVSYARSIADNITNGMNLDRVVSIIATEVPYFNMDVLQTVQLANYFLEEKGRPERLDDYLNISSLGVASTSSGITPDMMEAYAFSRLERQREACVHLARAAVHHMAAPKLNDFAVTAVKGDLMHDDLDNVLFAQCLNEELENIGSTRRFTQYLEIIEEN